MLRFVPGFVGAIAALVALELAAFFSAGSLLIKVIAFVIAYLVATYAVDKAMSQYGQKP